MKISTIKKIFRTKKTKEVRFVKKVPAHPRLRLKRKIMLKNLQIKKEKEKNKSKVEWIRTIIGNKNPKFKKEDDEPKFQEQNPDVQYIKTIKGKEKTIKIRKVCIKKKKKKK